MVEQVPLLQTKLHMPPVRPELVSRPRLIERLTAALPTGGGFPHTLTLISAPAGFGKTTLVSEWVHTIEAQHPSSTRDSSAPLHASVPTPHEVTWLSLDESDNDPVRFLTYLIAALRRVEPEIGKGALSALQSPQPPPTGAVLIPLINEISAIPARILFVLDDYHLIEAQPIHDALNFLLEHLPPQMHLVIATREDPPLPLGRLRARGQLTELRAADLRFTPSEAAEFLNQVMGLDLSAEEITTLETRTEGWIAGLQLAALALQGVPLQGTAPQGRSSPPGQSDTASRIKSFSGSHRYVLDYLVEEVLEQQSESVQTFLLRTSVLNQLTGSLCDAVCFGHAEASSTTGADAVRFGDTETPASSFGTAVHFSAGETPSGQATLDRLEQANLFIVPLDEERRWYRYHHLFADLLRRRLSQTQPQQVPALHQRASEWYEQNGFVDEAIEHALRAEAFERAARLIEELVDALWQRGEHTKLRRWLARLPDELLVTQPQLCIFHAWYLFTSGQQDAAGWNLQAAEQALGMCTDSTIGAWPVEQDPSPNPDRKKLHGRIAVTRASLAFFQGDVLGIIRHARQALEYLPEQDSAWRSNAAIALGDAYRIQGDIKAAHRARLEALEIARTAGNTYMILIASMKLAVTMRQQGRLEQVREICEQQLQLAEECGLSQTAVAGGFMAIWGEVLAELDDLAGALDRAKAGVELAEGGEDMVVLGWSYLCLMRVLSTRGDMAGAEELAKRVEDNTREFRIPPWINKMMAAWQVRLWLAQDKQEAVSRWEAERELDVDGDLQFLREVEQTVLARIHIAQGRWDESANLLQRLLESAETGEGISRVIEILILQALASQAQGEPAQAMTVLERALTLAEPGGFLRIFVDEGQPMARLLAQLGRQGVAVDYVERLLAAFETSDGGRQATEAAADPSPGVGGRSSAAHRPPSTLVEPLSEREVEVLQLIAEGLTNREIASRLFLSLNTVKAHTRNIYGKLDVHRRTQAIARSRELGLLPPR